MKRILLTAICLSGMFALQAQLLNVPGSHATIQAAIDAAIA
jgi:hypothetical protein